MIKKYSLKVLQQAINLALSLDDSMPGKIAQLDGKVIEIFIDTLGIKFFIQFNGQRLRLLDHYEEKPDTMIHSSPLGLIRLSLLPASKARSLFNDKIRISGDIELGEKVKKLFDELDIDWEGHLARFTGDVIAYQLGSFLRQGKDLKNRMEDSLRSNLNDYLHEEARLFPPREEVNDFFHDIDQLNLAVERLQAKLNLLKKAYETR
ncbi:SCP-2 sterol transfer family protein [Legionella birminghamensis]|uniref:Ubiquinone biosynthesis accessory factor UbiJ n=1 Tax=Legionella birminghamensis TaxID=28083 RepID=A0A378IEQ8_9GAMM|nr:SCP2 sterol-binding domain-containing protein [Legionella birminghamensis]KTC68816.1 SCP-2 sterol transfer family protein [Legionella birminghamensis]STX33242.1 Protein YigP [Legionella birminghamensis]